MKIRKPPALSPPGPVGIIAPASAPLSNSDLTRGIQRLADAGFRSVRLRPEIVAHGYLAGDDGVRSSELTTALTGDGPDALFCVRGGYGTLRMLDRIDYEAARRRPRLIIGYSDITALQLALLAKSGWTSISGPMVAVDWKEPTQAVVDQFLALAGGRHEDELLGPTGEQLGARVPGAAEGRLVGGNLTLITRLVGTPFLPDMEGAILFLEEVGEPPYRIDGMLAQLRLAGILDRLAGIVLGGFTNADPEPDRPSLSLEQVFDDYFAGLGIPVAEHLAYGHFPVKSAIPVGVRARLEVSSERASLKLLEQVVEAR